MIVSIGHDNFVRSELVAVVLSPDGAAAKRLRNEAQEAGKLVNATAGKKVRSIIVLATGQVVLSSVSSKVMAERLDKPS